MLPRMGALNPWRTFVGDWKNRHVCSQQIQDVFSLKFPLDLFSARAQARHTKCSKTYTKCSKTYINNPSKRPQTGFSTPGIGFLIPEIGNNNINIHLYAFFMFIFVSRHFLCISRHLCAFPDTCMRFQTIEAHLATVTVGTFRGSSAVAPAPSNLGG